MTTPWQKFRRSTVRRCNDFGQRSHIYLTLLLIKEVYKEGPAGLFANVFWFCFAASLNVFSSRIENLVF